MRERAQKTLTEITEPAIFRLDINKGLLPILINKARREKHPLLMRPDNLQHSPQIERLVPQVHV